MRSKDRRSIFWAIPSRNSSRVSQRMTQFAKWYSSRQVLSFSVILIPF